MERSKPLYRKVNTQARGVRHASGGDWRWFRNTRGNDLDMSPPGAMHGKQRRGLDYTPLFKFLLARVGQDWDATYREAVARIDHPAPIFWLVARQEDERKPRVRIGGRAFYSGLYVDENNRLAVVDPDLSVETMEPSCACCTHTFNGVRFVKPYRWD
jgi:hypothetical protein